MSFPAEASTVSGRKSAALQIDDLYWQPSTALGCLGVHWNYHSKGSQAVLMSSETFEKAVWLPLRSSLVVGSEGEEIPNEALVFAGRFKVDRLLHVV
jgi:hypothetical protein